MTKLNRFTGIACVWFAAGGLASLLYGGDWPMWRHDASHSAYTPDPLAAELHLQWVRKLPKPQPAWPPHQYKLQFDLSYEPVVTTIGARNLLTFRSSAAGYFDLANNGGTGNLGGFRSGCTSNLIAANGVLNAPDYTQTCTCSFQNQTSLAFVPMPTADIWTFNTIEPSDKPILRLGVNFGAPGDRMADDGTLWLDYPSVGGRSPQVEIETAGEVRYYRCDSSHVASGPLPWVTASGAEGIEEVRIRLAAEPDYQGLYTVRLYFAEPEQADTRSRMFDVTIDGRPVLEGFDVAAEAGSVRTGIVRQFTHVLLKKDVKVGFRAIKGRILVCGIELIADCSPTGD